MFYPGEQPQQMPAGDFPRSPHQPPPLRQTSASSSNLQPDYHPAGAAPPHDARGDSFAAKRARKLVHRRAVDYTSTVVRYLQVRMWQQDARDSTVLQPTPAAAIDMLPTVAYADNPSTSFATKFVHASTNKNRCSINCVLWTPSGRRLITGSQSGEFTLWNGQSFNFEMILQAHDQAIRSMVWSHNENWMVSGDDGGSIKYWQTNMNNVKNKPGHKESVRDLSFSRTDLKFCSCSDDSTIKVWDFALFQEERSLSGHCWDVKSVDWHPTKSLLASGGKDSLVKLWDAKSGKELCSLHGHKTTVLCVKWNQNGNWLLTAGKDQIIKLYDVRAMKELESFRGHQKDVTALAWHPFHEEYFVSGSFDGSIFHWLVGHESPQIEIVGAHENSVWDLAWHPIGYILCSGSNDHTTRFWCRNRPGDPPRDTINMNYNQGYGDQIGPFAGRTNGGFPMPEGPNTPGPFGIGLSRNDGTIPGVGMAMPLSLDSSDQSGEQRQPLVGAPPLPPGLPPPIQQQIHQQGIAQQQQQQQQYGAPQQMVASMMPPHNNMQQLQAPSHMPLGSHPHLPRPPSLPHGMLPPMQPSMSNPSSMPLPMVMQGPGNQTFPPVQQGHMMGMNPAINNGGPVPSNVMPMGSFPNGMANMRGQSNASGAQTFPHGGMNQTQPGQMGTIPGLNSYQQPGMGMRGNMELPGFPPPPPPPRMPHHTSQ